MSGPGRLLAALLLAWGFAAGARAAVFDYLYVEPNVGSSSGGHVAVRFGDVVYDFQNDRLNTLRLRRTPYEHFRYVYSVVENRPIHVARIEVSDATYARLRDRFNGRTLVQNKHFAVLEALQDDRRLIRFLRDRLGDATVRRPKGDAALPGLRLRGAGLFYGGEADEAPGTSPVLTALRARVEASHGGHFLPTRMRALEGGIAGLAPSLDPPAPATLSPDALPPALTHFSEHARDLALELLALRALADARPLRPDARRATGFVLGGAELRRLRAFAAVLETRLAELVTSTRPDRGFALLVGMGRLEALHASLGSGRLVLLDAFPDAAPTVPPDGVRRRSVFWAEILEQERARLASARRRFAEMEVPGEADYTRLEEAGNRVLEIRGGLEEGRAIRLHADALVPSRAAAPAWLPLPRLGADALRRAEAVAAARERARAREIEDAFGYHLLLHNCVSEVFATIEAELGRARSERELGGTVAPTGSLAFIPVVSFRAVRDAWAPAQVGEIPSYRRARLESMVARENDLAVTLRESNTLTSTIYRRNDRDAFFLFFTDGRVAPRPLLGAFNLAAGAGQTALGLLRAPLDRGRTLWAGLQGIGFSLPELVFVNLRKGTLEYGPSDPPRTALRLEPGGSR